MQFCPLTLTLYLVTPCIKVAAFSTSLDYFAAQPPNNKVTWGLLLLLSTPGVSISHLAHIIFDGTYAK